MKTKNLTTLFLLWAFMMILGSGVSMLGAREMNYGLATLGIFILLGCFPLQLKMYRMERKSSVRDE